MKVQPSEVCCTPVTAGALDEGQAGHQLSLPVDAGLLVAHDLDTVAIRR